MSLLDRQEICFLWIYRREKINFKKGHVNICDFINLLWLCQRTHNVATKIIGKKIKISQSRYPGIHTYIRNTTVETL